MEKCLHPTLPEIALLQLWTGFLRPKMRQDRNRTLMIWLFPVVVLLTLIWLLGLGKFQPAKEKERKKEDYYHYCFKLRQLITDCSERIALNLQLQGYHQFHGRVRTPETR